jgi:class 3 adenylate cyclase
LCGSADANQIVISENTFLDVQTVARVRELEPQVLKGIQRQVKTYELLSISE